MPHVVLLGDSVFDNAPYVDPGREVIARLREILPGGWRATLLAVDGAAISDVAGQLRHVPADASHLALSVGGNDALQNADLLSLRVRSSAEVLLEIERRVSAFEGRYQDLAERLLSLRLPAVVCSIYPGHLPEEAEARAARPALAAFNDAIFRVAFGRGLDLLDLRLVCRDPGDYVLSIEPSAAGSRKIALAVARAVGALESPATSRVWAGEAVGARASGKSEAT